MQCTIFILGRLLRGNTWALRTCQHGKGLTPLKSGHALFSLIGFSAHFFHVPWGLFCSPSCWPLFPHRLLCTPLETREPEASLIKHKCTPKMPAILRPGFENPQIRTLLSCIMWMWVLISHVAATCPKQS